MVEKVNIREAGTRRGGEKGGGEQDEKKEGEKTVRSVPTWSPFSQRIIREARKQDVERSEQELLEQCTRTSFHVFQRP